MNASIAPPIATAQLEPRTGRIPDRLSGNWINAAVRLAIASGLPLLLHAANGLLDEPWFGEDFMVLLWMFVFIMGIFVASDAWHGKLDHRTVGIDPDYTMLMGVACWPLRRSRALRIDALARVRFRRIAYGRWSLDEFFVLQEAGGATVMVENEPWVRAVVFDALAKGDVRVSYLASRELAGMFTWWSYPLAFVRFMVYLLVGGGAGTLMAAMFGLSL